MRRQGSDLPRAAGRGRVGRPRLRRALAAGVAVPVALGALLACASTADPLPARSAPAEEATPQTGTGAAGTSPSGGSSPAAPTSAAPPAPAGQLTALDSRTCQEFVDARGAAQAWLLRLERKGSIPPGEFVAGDRDLRTMAGVAESTFLYQTESPPLREAMQAVVREGRIVADALATGAPVFPVPLRTALDGAATVCEQGGVPIRWYGP